MLRVVQCKHGAKLELPVMDGTVASLHSWLSLGNPRRYFVCAVQNDTFLGEQLGKLFAQVFPQPNHSGIVISKETVPPL